MSEDAQAIHQYERPVALATEAFVPLGSIRSA
jgi:hypothetical protein